MIPSERILEWRAELRFLQREAQRLANRIAELEEILTVLAEERA